jgi:hypothetical protein
MSLLSSGVRKILDVALCDLPASVREHALSFSSAGYAAMIRASNRSENNSPPNTLSLSHRSSAFVTCGSLSLLCQAVARNANYTFGVGARIH